MYFWVASYPRSGSNFAVLSLARLFGFKRAVAQKPARALQLLGLPADGDFFSTLDDADDVICLKTHKGAPEDDRAPVIHVVRDGRDCVVSHAHYLKDRKKGLFRKLDFEQTLERVIRKGSSHGNWSENARLWMDRSTPIAVVHFEDLIRDPAAVLQEAVKSIGVPVPRLQKRAATFEKLHERDPVGYRRGEPGGWRDELPKELEELFWELHGNVMESFGYSR